MPNRNDASLEELSEAISAEFLKAGIILEPLELRRLAWLHRLLMSRNDELDLTRVDDPRSIIVKHYLDSALAASMMEAKGVLLDLGSGAGFPGLPMAIMRPDWNLLLSEPRAKRLSFIEEAVSLLGLENVEVYPHKVSESFDAPVGSLVARDFGPCGSIITLAARILPPGGRLFLMKGPAVDNELEAAMELPEWSEFGSLADGEYSLGPGWPGRRLISLTKRGREQQEKTGKRRVTEIASPMNAAYKEWLKLLGGRGAKKAGLAILSGRKSVPEALERHPEKVAGILAMKARDYEELPIPENVPLFHLRNEIFPALDVFGTGPPLLLIKAPTPPPWDPEEGLSPKGGFKPKEAFKGTRILVPFQDPANVGTAIRTAAAFGIDVVLLKEAANPYHPKALRASGPAVFQARLYSGPALSEIAPKKGYYALSPDGPSIHGFNPPLPLHLVMGLEGQGLGESWPRESRLSIPMLPGVESLNAAAAAAIAMALATARRSETGAKSASGLNAGAKDAKAGAEKPAGRKKPGGGRSPKNDPRKDNPK